MSQAARDHAHETSSALAFAPGPSESASATEHQAALEATLFRRDRQVRELVLELEAGVLRLRRSRD
jgi:hypothetical protein